MAPAEFAAVRHTLGLSQRRLADVLGVHHTTIARWETGIRPIPQIAINALTALQEKAMPIYDHPGEIDLADGETRSLRVGDIAHIWHSYAADGRGPERYWINLHHPYWRTAYGDRPSGYGADGWYASHWRDAEVIEELTETRWAPRDDETMSGPYEPYEVVTRVRVRLLAP